MKIRLYFGSSSSRLKGIFVAIDERKCKGWLINDEGRGGNKKETIKQMNHRNHQNPSREEEGRTPFFQHGHTNSNSW